MDWHLFVFEVIDMRSFSNLWFWIALAVLWSTTSHWILGVPYDMVTRAQRKGGQHEQDLCDLVRINVNRMLHVVEVSGTYMLSGTCFALTVLASLGFVYHIEFAQAVFLLTFPLSLVTGLSVRTAKKARSAEYAPEMLYRLLWKQRIAVQVVGMISIFVTALWGMFMNLQGIAGF